MIIIISLAIYPYRLGRYRSIHFLTSYTENGSRKNHQEAPTKQFPKVSILKPMRKIDEIH
jgi:hypothetical protein